MSSVLNRTKCITAKRQAIWISCNASYIWTLMRDGKPNKNSANIVLGVFQRCFHFGASDDCFKGRAGNSVAEVAAFCLLMTGRR